jgi:hypothetical protein
MLLDIDDLVWVLPVGNKSVRWHLNGLLSSCFTTTVLYAFLIFLMHATCPLHHLFLLDLFTLINQCLVKGKNYEDPHPNQKILGPGLIKVEMVMRMNIFSRCLVFFCHTVLIKSKV